MKKLVAGDCLSRFVRVIYSSRSFLFLMRYRMSHKLCFRIARLGRNVGDHVKAG